MNYLSSRVDCFRGNAHSKWIYIYIHSIILILLQLYTYFLLDLNNSSYIIRSLSIIGILVLLICIYSWKRVTRQIFCPYIMFLLSFFMFQFGQCFLIALGIELKSTRIFGYFADSEIIKAQIFTIKSLIAFNMGALLIHPNRERCRIKSRKKITSMKFVGWGLFSISAPVAFYFNTIIAINSLRYGYVQAAYEMDLGQSPLFDNLQSFFIPATIMLLIVYNKNQQMKNFFFFILSSFALINLMIGTRTVFVSIALTLLWYYSMFTRKINFRKLLFIMILGYYLFLFMLTVGNYRGITNKSFDEFWSLFEDKQQDSPIVEIIEEFGGSMYPLIQVQRIIPKDEEYRLGESYFYSTTTLIPNIGRILGDRHPAMEHSLLDQWLMNYLNLSYGPGFSLVAEAYYNFGDFGLIIIFFIGIIISRLLGYFNKKELKNNPYKLFIVTTSIILIFTAPRRQFVDIFGQYFRFVFVPYLLILFVNKIKR